MRRGGSFGGKERKVLTTKLAPWRNEEGKRTRLVKDTKMYSMNTNKEE